MLERIYKHLVYNIVNYIYREIKVRENKKSQRNTARGIII